MNFRFKRDNYISLEHLMNENKTPLQYDNYKEYYFENRDGMWISGKHQWLFKFENGYGASVIKHYGSYGFEDDLFELGVIKFNKNNSWNLCYDTPITNDVIGYLTNEEVLEFLERIKNL